MQHNIFLCQELLSKYGRQGIAARCAFKIDIHKASDSVEWEFLESVLKGLGFHVMTIRWIMACVTTTQFSIIINAALEGFFDGKRGLRQSGPLSPLLFTVCMEYLSRMLSGAKDNKELSYHPRCASMKITHLCFVDDLMIFCKGNLGSVKVIKTILEEFGTVLGLQLNAPKSRVYLGSDSEHIHHFICKQFNMAEGLLPTGYLGIPIHS